MVHLVLYIIPGSIVAPHHDEALDFLQVEAIVIKEYDKYPVHMMPLTAGIIFATYGYMPVDLNELSIVYENVTKVLEDPDAEEYRGETASKTHVVVDSR